VAINYIVHNAKNSMELECDLILLILVFLHFKVSFENCIDLDYLMTIASDWISSA
jgi:hypothetical protein